ncbi:MAG: UDP-glucose 4-epimerase GalE, partial [Chitinophagaceae bacterium]
METKTDKTPRCLLITGGSGYLGSHLSKRFKLDGWEIIIVDTKRVEHKYYDYYYPVDVRDRDTLFEIFAQHSFDMVFHLAGRIEVGESMKHPTEFWDVNVGGTINVLQAMVKNDLNNIIFSSTAGVYKTGKTYTHSDEAFCEDAETTFRNSCYASTKLACERLIADSNLNHLIFRYFNLAGADPDGDLGETHDPETHLIPNILRQSDAFTTIYGNDYCTSDGTCVRDYIHVMDVVDAHVEAVKFLNRTIVGRYIFNLGQGKGYSVLEIIEAIKKETGIDVKYKIGDRRHGDPEYLVADIAKAKEFLK